MHISNGQDFLNGVLFESKYIHILHTASVKLFKGCLDNIWLMKRVSDVEIGKEDFKVWHEFHQE